MYAAASSRILRMIALGLLPAQGPEAMQRPIVPATTGAEKLVPELTAYRLPGKVDETQTPGAAIVWAESAARVA